MSTLSELTPEKRTGRHYHLSTLPSPEPTRKKKDAPAASVSPGPATPAFAEPLARESTLACPAHVRLGQTRPVSGAGGAAWRPSRACPRLRGDFVGASPKAREGGRVGLAARKEAGAAATGSGWQAKSRLASRVRTLLARLGVARRDERFNAGRAGGETGSCRAMRGRSRPALSTLLVMLAGSDQVETPPSISADWTGRGGWAERRLRRRPSSDPYRTARRPAGAPFPFLVGPTRRGGHMRVTVTRQRC